MVNDYPHLLRCSAAYRMLVYIVDRLFESMFTKGSGRTEDVLYHEVLLCILLIHPLQSGRGRIICKHRNNVYNKVVSGIINEGINGKQHPCLNSFVNIIIKQFVREES